MKSQDPTFFEILAALPSAFRRPLLEKIAAASPEIVAAIRPAPLSRAERLAERDAAIRRALAEHYSALPPTPAAKALAADLGRYISGPWLRERDLLELPEGVSAHRVSLHRIARLNESRGLAYRQVLNVRDGFRGA